MNTLLTNKMLYVNVKIIKKSSKYVYVSKENKNRFKEKPALTEQTTHECQLTSKRYG